jgi:hypothetical protein
MSASFILSSRYMLSGCIPADFVAGLAAGDHAKHYVDSDRTEVLQLRGYDRLADFAGDTDALDNDLKRAKPYMSGGDVRRELLRPSQTWGCYRNGVVYWPGE